MIKVSVIVPVYNSEKFLHKCLDSLVNQSLKEIEFICINDGSTDNSLEILKKYAQKDSRIKIINQENKGIATTRNIGLEAANGEYTGFVDSDDWIDANFFEKMYAAAQKYNADIACCSIIRVGKYIKKYRFKVKEEKTFENIQDKLQAAHMPKYSYLCNKIYKTQALRQTAIKFTDGRVYEDLDWNIKIFYYLKKLVTVPETKYYYRRNSSSIVLESGSQKDKDLIWAQKRMIEFAAEKGIELSKESNRKQKTCIKIFGITVMKIYRWEAYTKYKLFGFIPIMERRDYA